MKGITRITRRLISLFLVLVASSMMFLSSPVVAATSSLTLLTSDNFATEVAQSNKPVIAILADKTTLDVNNTSLENLKLEAGKVFGDKYKIVVGTLEENYNNPEFFVPAPLVFPPYATLVSFKNGKKVTARAFPTGRAKDAFEDVKNNLES